MKKVLILAYYFPPLGMGGTQRVAKFVKYLPEFGWQPIVVTVKDIAYHAKDPSLLEDVSPAAVYRTGSLDPQRLLAIFSRRLGSPALKQSSAGRLRRLNKFVSWFFVPDAKLLWLPFVVARALKIIRQQRIDCLMTTSPPHSAHLAGIILKKITGLPLLLDFRDGWSGGNFQSEPTPVHRWLNRALEKLALRSADAIVTVSQRLTERLSGLVTKDRQRFFTITNGYDAEDFSDAPGRPPDQKFTITYCGALTAMAPLDGFWRALSRFLQTRPDARSDLLVKLVGQNLLKKLENRLREMNLFDSVECTGYVPHREALHYLQRADLLLYPVAPWSSMDFIPGKTFEYLASGTPVLALGPKVEGVAILQQAGHVEIFSHADTEAISQTIFKYYALFKSGELQKHPNRAIQSIERKVLTRRLAESLDYLSSRP